MLFLGVKATHDGGVAVIDGDRLLCSLEMEKIGNGLRYSELGDLDLVRGLLADEGIDLADVDRVAVDGWGYGELATAWKGESLNLPVAPYREARLGDDSLTAHAFGGLRLGGDTVSDYQSFHHTTGHIMSAYCASPFARAGQPSFVLVWDGGVLPRAYYVRPEAPHIENLGPIFGLLGNVYAVFAMHLDPFKMDDPFMIEAAGGAAERGAYNSRRLSVPGKVMAYTALGEARADLAAIMDRIYDSRPDDAMERPRPFVKEFITRFLDESAALEPGSADMLATLQQWIGGRLVESLRLLRDRHPGRAANLCFAGGCALNIKWNSAIRRSGVFDHVFVPPFPNDSGSAIGAACAAMVANSGRIALEWSAYAGPSLRPSAEAEGYISRACGVRELADLLYRFDEPIVVLHGRAELGPRALGNRSILAPATDAAMKASLNAVKRREDYRPVSPICLEARAPEIFDPGTPDPYMLFDHQTRPEWLDRVPAVVHLDGSARLQTVNARQNPVIAELLTEYEKLSGVPVLCNTSANYEGRGFFPDVESALEWGRTRYVWSEGTLWQRADPTIEDPDIL